MVGVGLLYLLYEESVLEQKSTFEAEERHISWSVSRTVIGAQVRVASYLHQGFSDKLDRSAS